MAMAMAMAMGPWAMNSLLGQLSLIRIYYQDGSLC
jgi:hypothetical protein